MITVENLTRKYGDFTAVDQVSFTIPKGEIVGLLGHNGAGKTTIMKMLTGYLEPTGGSIAIGELSMPDDSLAIQEQIGYLPEASPVYPDMGVVHYLEYVCELRNIQRSDRGAAIKRVIELTGLGEKALAQISTLSKGLKQRVGVAQALIHNPKILILDEPTSGLDPSQIQEIRDVIRDLSGQTETTVILSTHILQEVEAVCDRVIIVKQGKVAVDEDLEGLQSSNRLVVQVGGDSEVVANHLININGVEGVEAGGNGGGITRCLLEISQDAALVPKVAKSIIDKGWELYGLEVERRDLETVFREVNLGSEEVHVG